ELFDKTYAFLLCSHIRPLDGDEIERAFGMVCNYVFSNQRELERVAGTELSFRVEQKTYVLVGQIDLVRQGQDGLEIVDFKTTPRQDDPSRLETYKQQLHLYAHAMKRRTGTLPGKLFLYWMGEECKERALMEVPCQEHDVRETICSIDAVVEQIQSREFRVIHPPRPEICRSCDVRHLCRKERIISSSSFSP
ncbi:MAG: PD-(D/E)XK nuclease family protein, partial [Ktedonobacteraceae bacterium]